VLVVPEGWEEPATLLADDLVAGKVAAAVTGGSTRAASVAAGLAAVPDEADLILVHDAARPFATPELVSRVLEALGHADGAVPGVALTDTVKRVSGGLVAETPDRSQLVAQRLRADGRGAGDGHRLRIAGGGRRRQGRRRRGRPRQPQGDHTR
jgi:2-C-methyl-D-erythritol 4-phosphate cytidylyltransferase